MKYVATPRNGSWLMLELTCIEAKVEKFAGHTANQSKQRFIRKIFLRSLFNSFSWDCQWNEDATTQYEFSKEKSF